MALDRIVTLIVLSLLLLNYCEGFVFPPSIVISKWLMPNTAVQLKFSSSDQVRTLPLVEGNSYQLQCKREGSVAGSFQWLRDGVPVSDTSSVFVENANTITPGLMIIEFNSTRDGAMYSCTVGSVAANMMITFGNPIVIPSTEEDYRRGAVSGVNRETLTMFVDGKPMPTIFMWFFNGNILQTRSSPSTIVDRSEVILSRILFHDQSGNYTLLVNNSVGMAADSINLTVTLKPVLSLLPEMEVSVRANKNISITCVANVSVPPSTFHWVINRAVVNQSGNGFILKDVMVDSLLGQELQVASPAVTSSGTYRCVADNSYRDVMSSSSLEAHVSVTGPLPPTNFNIIPESDCSTQVTWVNQVENTANLSVVDSDSYLVEIQYITEGGPQIQPLLTATSSPAPATIKFVQQNTTYLLRGHGLSMEYGDSLYSDWFGPFYAFTAVNSNPPSISSVTVLEPGSLHVTWTSEPGCYKLHNFTVECIEDVTENPSMVQVMTTGTSASVSGLNSSSYYICRVNGQLFAVDINDDLVPVFVSSPYSNPLRIYTSPTTISANTTSDEAVQTSHLKNFQVNAIVIVSTAIGVCALGLAVGSLLLGLLCGIKYMRKKRQKNRNASIFTSNTPGQVAREESAAISEINLSENDSIILSDNVAYKQVKMSLM